MKKRSDVVIGGVYVVTVNEDSDGHDAYDVLAPSGNTYHVRYEGCGDGDENVNVWSCTCAGYGYRGVCKHIQAVIDRPAEAQ